MLKIAVVVDTFLNQLFKLVSKHTFDITPILNEDPKILKDSAIEKNVPYICG